MLGSRGRPETGWPRSGARVIHAGWVPVGLALGISLGARHDDWQTSGTTAWGAGNAEVDGYTELVNVTRHDARAQLTADVARMGAEGVVVSGSAHPRLTPGITSPK